MDSREIDALVVGAGPAGLTAAAALRRYGVEVLVLDRKARLSAHPRATVVSTRSMELLRSWGLEDEVRAGGMPDVEWLALVTRTLASTDRGDVVTLTCADSDAALRALLPAFPAMHSIEIRGAGLEEAFLELTTDDTTENPEDA